MANFPVQCKVRETYLLQPGHKACPFCNSIDIDKPASKQRFAAETNEEFKTYGSWVCLTCNNVFMHPKHLPTDNRWTPLELGTRFGEF